MSDVFKFVTSATPEVGKNKRFREWLPTIIIIIIIMFVLFKKNLKITEINISASVHLDASEHFNCVVYKYVILLT
jgi:hypothetical protein